MTSASDIPNNIIEEEAKNNNNPPIEVPDRSLSSSAKSKRNVSFAEEKNVFYENKDIDREVQYHKQQPVLRDKIISSKPRLPSANEVSVDQMDSNLRMLIVKELSKDSQVFQPSSRKSSSNIFPWNHHVSLPFKVYIPVKHPNQFEFEKNIPNGLVLLN